MYTYNWYQWLAFFYIYCFFGWIFESVYVSIKKQHPINRGFLRIPMLPLYGSGAVMMLWVSLPVRDNLFLVWVFGVIAATVLEYVTGSIMEQLFKVRYWDYSNQKFQVHGYICLTSSIAWGFLTILMTEVIHTPIANVVLSFNSPVLLATVLITSVIFLIDFYESTKAALVLGKTLETMTKLKADMEEIQSRVATLKEEAAEQIFTVRDETALRFYVAKADTSKRIVEFKEDTLKRLEVMKKKAGKRLTSMGERANEHVAAASLYYQNSELAHLLEQLEETRQKKQALLSRGGLHRFRCKNLLKRNPGAISSRFAAALKELREEIEK